MAKISADLCQPRMLLLFRQAGKIILLLVVKTGELQLKLFRQRTLLGTGQEDQPIPSPGDPHQKSLCQRSMLCPDANTASHRRPYKRSSFEVRGPRERLWRLRCFPLGSQSTGFHRYSTATVLETELVAPGVPAKIVVVIEDQNARTLTGILAVEVSRSQPVMPPPTTTKSYVSFVSAGLPAVSQKSPSRSACATSYEPGALPLIPVKAGGLNLAESATRLQCSMGAVTQVGQAGVTQRSDAYRNATLRKSRRVMRRPIPNCRSRFSSLMDSRRSVQNS